MNKSGDKVLIIRNMITLKKIKRRYLHGKVMKIYCSKRKGKN